MVNLIIEKISRILRPLAAVLALILLIGSIFTVPVLAATDEDAVYSTKDGDWYRGADENTWIVVKKGGTASNPDDIIATVIKKGDQWDYYYNVKDPDADYYGWEPDSPNGYTVAGKGTRQDPAQRERIPIGEKKYSHTSNLDDNGKEIKSGGYGNNTTKNQVVTVPGAKKLEVQITYQAEENERGIWDWACIWAGNHKDYTAKNDYGKAVMIDGYQQLSGTTKTTKIVEIDGDTVTFGFCSDSNTNNFYGYYAVVTGMELGDISITNTKGGSKPDAKTGGLTLTKKLSGVDASDTDALSKNFRFDVTLSSKDAALQKKLTGTKTFGTVTFTDGKGIIYLKGGETAKLTGIPAGVDWKIQEAEAAGYTSSMSVDGTASATAGSASGKIQDGTDISVICTNTAGGQGTDSGSFKVKKVTVNGTDSDEFQFSAALQKLKADTDYKVMVADTNGENRSEKVFHTNASGTAYVEFALKNGETAEFTGLPVGSTYQVKEEASDYTASYEITSEDSSALKTVMSSCSNADKDQALSTQKETLDPDEKALITFTNTKPGTKTDVVDITVNKSWMDDDNADGVRPESINVSLYQSEQENEEGDMIGTAQLDADGGWTYTFKDLDKYQPDGESLYYYTVKEDPVAGYDSSVTTGEDGTVTITNKRNREVGDLKISKTTGGANAPDEKFKFTISLTRKVADEDGTEKTVPVKGVYSLDSSKGTKTGTVYFDENGEAEITLKADQSAYIKGLPAGAEYTVTEEALENWSQSLEAGSAELTGTIVKDQTVDIKVKNTWYETASLTIGKTVQGNMGNKFKKFHFTLKLEIPEGITCPADLSCVKDGKTEIITLTDGTYTFELAHGENIQIVNIPKGSKYSIVETDADDYQTTYTVGETAGLDKIDSESLSGDAKVTVLNERNFSVPTLVSMNNLIPLLLVLVAGIVCFGLIWKKRRHRNV